MWLSRVLLSLGVIAGAISMWQTLAFSWDPDFQAPALLLGPTHTNYHAFRGFTLSLGASLVLLYGIFLPQSQRTRPMWIVLCVTALCYYGGWWLPGPLLTLHAPSRAATITHLVATFLSLTGVVLSWRFFPGVRSGHMRSRTVS